VLLELGQVEADHGAPGAAERLSDALAAGLSGDDAARARAARARQMILRDPVAAADELEAAVAGAEGAEVRLGLQSLLFDVTAYDPAHDQRRAVLLEAGRRDPDPSLVVLAHLAQDAAYRSAPAADVAALARRALEGGRLLSAVGPQGTYHLLILALRHAEQAALAAEALAAGEAAVRRMGSRHSMYFMDHGRAYWELMFGSVAAAEAHARSALAITEEAALPLGRLSLISILAEVLIERDQLDEAEAHINSLELTPQFERVVSGSDLVSARAELHRLRGRLDLAERDARRARELVRARGWTTPLKSLAGIRLAEVLVDRGDGPGAIEVLEPEAAAARQAGTPGTLGMITRVRGRAVGGDAGIALLEQAVELLERSDMTLERAWALHDLGHALRRAGRTVVAREPLRRAVDDANRIGAARLAELAREELLAAGARPRRDALSGPGSLTPSERRVAGLAADGLSNREIAETLWVTRKTVELHLGKAYGKLGIRSRKDLAEALSA
jgi:ATP/maltotriose-dependent transcriptional regulator MalT